MYGTLSRGIAHQNDLSLFLGRSIQKLSINKIDKLSDNDAAIEGIVGWGHKPNTLQAETFAKALGIPFIRMEDGFLGYWGHPASSASVRLSIVKDNVGIYYDATQPSELETILLSQKELTEGQRERAQFLRRQFIQHGLSKYNGIHSILPSTQLDQLKGQTGKVALVIDQTFGDQSIRQGRACQSNFEQMLQQALEDHPTGKVWVKTHPDVLTGKKQGYLGKVKHDRVRFITDSINPQELLYYVHEVYTVTSQFGFEALLAGKTVKCFGLPFYAGWGLTYDYGVHSSRRNITLSIEQLVHAALIDYPVYVHPDTKTVCEIEDIIDWLCLQQDANKRPVAYAYQFSRWKKAFVHRFLSKYYESVEYIDNQKALDEKLAACEVSRDIIVWGKQRALSLQSQGYERVKVMEDGFIRSTGLGVNLKRPSSLVLDDVGIYYDSTTPSRLENILNSQELTPSQLERASALQEKIKRNKTSKYNVGTEIAPTFEKELSDVKSSGRNIVLVCGQVGNDASVQFGRAAMPEDEAHTGRNTSSTCLEQTDIVKGDIVKGEIVKDNFELVQAAKEKYPSAYIIYKPHPDVVSGNRAGADREAEIAELVDCTVNDTSLGELLPLVDTVSVLSSLAGFEALLLEKEVDCYGWPFYAGWGLTNDHICPPRRLKELTIAELVYGALIEYPDYINWDTKQFCQPEWLIDELSKSQKENISKLNSMQRLWVKMNYLAEAWSKQ